MVENVIPLLQLKRNTCTHSPSLYSCGHLEVFKDKILDGSVVMGRRHQPIFCIIHRSNGPVAEPVT